MREDSKLHWLRMILDRYDSKILTYTLRFVPEKVAHQIVVEAFLDLWNIERDYTDEGALAYLYSFCRKQCRLYLKKDDGADSDEVTTIGPAILDQSEKTRAEAALSLVSHLPANEKEIVKLKFQEGLGYRQISVITGRSAKRVGIFIHTTIIRLRHKLKLLDEAEAAEALEAAGAEKTKVE